MMNFKGKVEREMNGRELAWLGLSGRRSKEKKRVVETGT
jgi:hypothetical protein